MSQKSRKTLKLTLYLYLIKYKVTNANTRTVQWCELHLYPIMVTLLFTLKPAKTMGHDKGKPGAFVLHGFPSWPTPFERLLFKD